MNKDQVSGNIDQAIGKTRETLGNAVGDEHSAREGAVQQLKGDAEKILGKVGETADALIAQAKTVIGHSEEVAAVRHQDLRARVLLTAQKFTDEITGKLDKFNQRQEAKRKGKRETP